MLYDGDDKFYGNDDSNVEHGTNLIDPKFSNKQIAREACEIFYQHNNFRVESGKVPEFLKIRFEGNLGGRVLFRPAAWLKNIVIELETNYDPVTRVHDYSHHVVALKLMLTCPRLKRVAIALGGPKLFERMMVIGKASEDLKERIGPGFVVYGPSSRSCHHECGKRDLSWIWQAPDEFMKKRVKEREATVQEVMRVILAPFLDPEEPDSELPTPSEVRAVGQLDRWYQKWTSVPCTYTKNSESERS